MSLEFDIVTMFIKLFLKDNMTSNSFLTSWKFIYLFKDTCFKQLNIFRLNNILLFTQVGRT